MDCRGFRKRLYNLAKKVELYFLHCCCVELIYHGIETTTQIKSNMDSNIHIRFTGISWFGFPAGWVLRGTLFKLRRFSFRAVKSPDFLPCHFSAKKSIPNRNVKPSHLLASPFLSSLPDELRLFSQIIGDGISKEKLAQSCNCSPRKKRPLPGSRKGARK